jgi:hypothetical protein
MFPGEVYLLPLNIKRTLDTLCHLYIYIVRRSAKIKIANRSFENVSQFKYLETTVTIQNLIQEEIKRD